MAPSATNSGKATTRNDRKSGKPAPERTLKTMVHSDLDTHLRPPESPESDTGMTLEAVRRQAESDARSGAWDRFAIEAQVGQLPAEEFIDREIERKQNEHRNTIRNRELMGRRLVHDVSHNHVTADGRLISGVGAELELQDSHDRIGRITAIRDEAVAHLEGRAKDSDGTP